MAKDRLKELVDRRNQHLRSRNYSAVKKLDRQIKRLMAQRRQLGVA